MHTSIWKTLGFTLTIVYLKEIQEISSVTKTFDNVLAKKLVRQMVNNMDITTGHSMACRNFHRYTCTNSPVIRTNSFQNIPPRVTYAKSEYYNESIHRIVDLLESSSNASLFSQELSSKVRLGYQTCMKLEVNSTNWNIQIKKIEKRILGIGEWPMMMDNVQVLEWKKQTITKNRSNIRTVVKLLCNYEKKYGKKSLFAMDITYVKTENSPYIRLRESNEFIRNIQNISKRNFTYTRQMIIQQAMIATPSCVINANVLRERLEEVHVFRKKLLKIRSDFNGVSEKASIHQVEEIFGEDLTDILNEWSIFMLGRSNPPNQLNNFRASKNIVLGSKKYFQKLIKLLEETDLVTIVNHIHLEFFEKYSIHVNLLLRSLLLGTSLETEIKNRYRTCIEEHTMRDFLMAIYAERYLSLSTVKEVSRVIRQLKQSIKKIIYESNYGLSTKQHYVDKINKLVIVLASFPWYRNEFFKHRYDKCIVGRNHLNNILSSKLCKNNKHNLPRVSKFYEITDETSFLFSAVPRYLYRENKLIVPFAAMEFPYYDAQKLPQFTNYARLGFQIAREIVRAIFGYGLYYDTRGNYQDALTWWLPKEFKIQNQQMDCFIWKYGVYADDGKSLSRQSVMRAINTLNENVADVLGLQIAFRTYSELSIEESLMYWTLLAPKQMFFVSWGTGHCFLWNQELFHESSSLSKFSSPSMRFTGAIDNLPEFFQVMSCSDNKSETSVCRAWYGGTSA